MQFSVDKRKINLESHILTLRDKGDMSVVRMALSADITAETEAKYRRGIDNFDIFLVVSRAVCNLHMDSSSLSMLPRDTWSGFVGLTNLFLVLQGGGDTSSTVKYQTTSTSIALSWNFLISV